MSAELPADRAVVDRIEAGIAVLLVGPAGEQHELDAARLPAGVQAGDVVTVHVDTATDVDPGTDVDAAADDVGTDVDGQAPATSRAGIQVGGVDRELTDARRASAEQRLARIRRERPGGRFG